MTKVNESMAYSGNTRVIGVLDIYGFEVRIRKTKKKKKKKEMERGGGEEVERRWRGGRGDRRVRKG